ncbi:hypothetical protein ACIBCT_35745 [Streptosporangium sp. NPDC050855]|uniref:hypothetical protein n=1 Tax=Streptosporangium sp. NPDC050855 TaxID=3366194 RepID=UPI00378DD36B
MSDPNDIPAEGESWQLIDDWGVGPGMLLAGAEVTVLGIYPPGTPGIGYSEHDSAVCQHTGLDGNTRFLALAVPDFIIMFRKVS